MSFLFGALGKGLDFYHIGMTVPDLSTAMELYSLTFGFDWATPHERTPTVIVDGVPRETAMAVTYSIQGPPHLELIEDRGGGVWGASGLSLTHAGFWAEDVAAAQRGLAEAGLTARMHAPVVGGAMRYSFHQTSSGLWIELVNTSFRDDLTSWIASTLGQD